MAENVIALPREFRKLILSKRGFQAASFNRCLHYVCQGVSLWQPVTYVTILNLGKKRKLKVWVTERMLIILITHMVCILTTLASKITAFYGVMCVTLIRLPFKHENCDQYHFLFSWYVHFPKCFDNFVLINSFELEKIQSLLYTLNIVSCTCN